MFYLAHRIPYLYAITLTSQWFFCLVGIISPLPPESTSVERADINVARQFSSWPFGTLQMSGITTITSITMLNFMDIMQAIKSLPGWLSIPLLYLPSPSNIHPTHPAPLFRPLSCVQSLSLLFLFLFLFFSLPVTLSFRFSLTPCLFWDIPLMLVCAKGLFGIITLGPAFFFLRQEKFHPWFFSNIRTLS